MKKVLLYEFTVTDQYNSKIEDILDSIRYELKNDAIWQEWPKGWKIEQLPLVETNGKTKRYHFQVIIEKRTKILKRKPTNKNKQRKKL